MSKQTINLSIKDRNRRRRNLVHVLIHLKTENKISGVKITNQLRAEVSFNQNDITEQELRNIIDQALLQKQTAHHT